MNLQATTKVCLDCLREKPVDEFHKRKNGSKDGYRNTCKTCWNKKTKKYDLSHKEKRRIYNKQYNLANKENMKSVSHQWRSKNKEHIQSKTKLYYLKNKKEMLLKNKQYKIDHKDKLIFLRRKYEQQRLKTDIKYRILRNYRGRVYQALRHNWKKGNTIELIGCSAEELKQHIERQWVQGMSWENWGIGEGKWNIDHIIPCSFFDLSDPVEQHMCFRYQNLQPLWWKDNREKWDKITIFSE